MPRPNARAKKKDESRDIHQTLVDLGVDPDLDPMAAAAEVQENDQRAVDATLVARLRAVPEASKTAKGGDDDEEDADDDEDDEDDEDEDEDEDEEEGGNGTDVALTSEARGPGRPRGRPPKKVPKTFTAPADEVPGRNRPSGPAPRMLPEHEQPSIPDPDEEMPQFFVPPPPPVGIKSKKIGRSPSTGKMGSLLSQKLPGAEKIKVYKRVNGQLGHVADYSARDLDGFSDVESFLHRYVTPEYGFGEFELKGLDGYGREMNVGQVLLLGPPSKKEADGAFGLVAQMMDQSQRQNAEWMNRMASVMTPPARQPAENPITMMRDLMGLQEMLGKEGKEAKANAEAAKSAAVSESTGAMASMMQMFMMTMQQQAQQNQQMMLAMMTPREDPMMKILMAKLLDDKPSGGGGGMNIPPPPAPADPLDGIAKLLAVLLPALGASGGDGNEEVKELLKAQIQAREAERLGPKDMLAIFQEMKQERGTDDFKRSADNLAMMLNITNQLRSSTEGSPAAGFWDALGALFSNRDFAGSIAQTVRARAEDQQKVQLQSQNQQLVIQRQALVVAEQRRRALAAAAAGAMPPVTQAAPDARPQPQPAPIDTPPAAAAPRAAPPARRASARASVPPPPKNDPLPRLPTNAADHLNGLTLAADDAERIERTVRMLIYFSGFPEWRAFTERLMGSAQSGEKTEMLQYLAAFFQRFVDTGLMTLDTAKAVLIAVKDNFDVIHGTLGKNEQVLEGPEEDKTPPDYLDVVDSTFDEEDDDTEEDDAEDDGEDHAAAVIQDIASGDSILS